MSNQLEQVLRLFPNSKKVSKGYMIKCPLHQDDTESLFLGYDESRNKLLMKCFAGCDIRSLLDWVNGKEVTKSSTIPLSKIKKLAGIPEDEVIESKWDRAFTYVDVYGKTSFEEVRFLDTYKSGKVKKRIAYRRPSTADEKFDFDIDWVWTLQGVTRIPYNLFELHRLKAGTEVFVVEGPSVAQYLIDNGYIATTIGGSSVSWSQQGHHLRDMNVVLFPDNDKPGYKHMLDTIHNIKDSVNSLRLVFLPGLEKTGDDIKDWFEEYGGTKLELKGLIENSSDIRNVSRETIEKLLTFPEKIDFPEAEIPLKQENSETPKDEFTNFLIGLEESTEKNNDLYIGICIECRGSGYALLVDNNGIERIKTKNSGDDTVLERCHVCSPQQVLHHEQEEESHFNF